MFGLPRNLEHNDGNDDRRHEPEDLAQQRKGKGGNLRPRLGYAGSKHLLRKAWLFRCVQVTSTP